MELEKYKYAIRDCFRAQGKAAIFFERYLQLRAGTHAHLQVLLAVIVLVICIAIFNCLEPELEFFLFWYIYFKQSQVVLKEVEQRKMK